MEALGKNNYNFRKLAKCMNVYTLLDDGADQEFEEWYADLVELDSKGRIFMSDSLLFIDAIASHFNIEKEVEHAVEVLARKLVEKHREYPEYAAFIPKGLIANAMIRTVPPSTKLGSFVLHNFCFLLKEAEWIGFGFGVD